MEKINTKVAQDKIDLSYCIVWSPLPPITWILPFIGHMGISDSKGNIYDFAGSYNIGKNDFAFGEPTKYIRLGNEISLNTLEYDEGVSKGCNIFSNRIHNICCDNCHSHVATCLNDIKYKGERSWNMIYLCFWMFISGKYINARSFLKTWLPFFILIIIIICSKYVYN